MTCPLNTGKLTLPSIFLDKPGKRCMDASRFRANNGPQLDSAFTPHDGLNGSYYGYLDRYLTTSNLHDPTVSAAFMRAVTTIEQCASDHGHDLNGCEVLVNLRCLSERNPKLSYYIVDHRRKTIGWSYGRRFDDSEDLYDVNMRDVAEYWDHRSRFCVHRPCNQEDYNELLGLLNALPTEGREARFSASDIASFRDRLAQRAQEPATQGGTATIAGLHANVLKAQLREFYEPNLSLKSKLMQSLHGIMRQPRFLHRRAHRAQLPTALGPQPANSDLGDQARGLRRSHPESHTGYSPVSSVRPSPQSSTDSEPRIPVNRT